VGTGTGGTSSERINKKKGRGKGRYILKGEENNRNRGKKLGEKVGIVKEQTKKKPSQEGGGNDLGRNSFKGKKEGSSQNKRKRTG